MKNFFQTTVNADPGWKGEVEQIGITEGQSTHNLFESLEIVSEINGEFIKKQRLQILNRKGTDVVNSTTIVKYAPIFSFMQWQYQRSFSFKINDKQERFAFGAKAVHKLIC